MEVIVDERVDHVSAITMAVTPIQRFMLPTVLTLCVCPGFRATTRAPESYLSDTCGPDNPQLDKLVGATLTPTHGHCGVSEVTSWVLYICILAEVSSVERGDEV